MRLIGARLENGRRVGGRQVTPTTWRKKKKKKKKSIPSPLRCTANKHCIFSGVYSWLLSFHPNLHNPDALKLLKVVNRRIWSRIQEWNRITCAKWSVIRLKHTHPHSLAAISPPLSSTWPLFHFACTNRSRFARNSITSNDGAITAVAAPATHGSTGDIDE